MGAACGPQTGTKVATLISIPDVVGPWQFKTCQLPNGLCVVLACAPDTVHAAVCVSVKAGSMQDPLLMPGCAHLLEHMVLCGSTCDDSEEEQQLQKREQGLDLKHFLGCHGGRCNGETGLAHTSFYAQVGSPGVAGVLERLAAAISAPALQPSTLNSCIDVVDSEFRRVKSSRTRALRYLKRSLLQGTRAACFTCGNANTLGSGPDGQHATAGMDALQAMHALWDAHYTAGNMRACVVAPNSLDELEQMVAASLGRLRAAPTPAHIPTAPSQTSLLTPPGPTLPGPGPGVVLGVGARPQAEPRLDLTWVLPHGATRGAGRGGYRPWVVVGHALGHEGHGSLAAALKARGLISSLRVGVEEEVRAVPGCSQTEACGCDVFMMWGVSMALTAAGVACVGWIVVEVHRVLGEVARLAPGARQAIASEMEQVCAVRYHCSTPCGPLAVACDVAHALHYYPPNLCLSGPALLGEYDDTAVTQFLAHLTPERLMVVVARHGAPGPNPTVDPHYGTRHTTAPLPAPLVAACQAVLPQYECLPQPGCTAMGGMGAGVAANHVDDSNQPLCWVARLMGCLCLQPPLGVVVPPHTSWALRAAAAHIEGLATPACGPPTPPTTTTRTPATQQALSSPRLLCTTHAIRVWHLREGAYGPQADVRVHIITPSVSASVAAYAYALVAARAVLVAVAPEVACAEQLGCRAVIECVDTGMVVQVKGLSSVAPRLLQLVLGGLQQLAQEGQGDWVDSVLPQAVREVVASLGARQNAGLAQHAARAVRRWVQGRDWGPGEMLAALQGQAPGTTAPACSSPEPESPPPPAPSVMPVSAAHVRGALLGLCGRVQVEVLVAGDVDEGGARALADSVLQVLRPQGLPPGTAWPQQHLRCAAAAATSAGCAIRKEVGAGVCGEGPGGCSRQTDMATTPMPTTPATPSTIIQPVLLHPALPHLPLVHLPLISPNPAPTTTSGLYLALPACTAPSCACQWGVAAMNNSGDGGGGGAHSTGSCGGTHSRDPATTLALLELLVEVAAPACVRVLRTQHRLGYVVSLTAATAHGFNVASAPGPDVAAAASAEGAAAAGSWEEPAFGTKAEAKAEAEVEVKAVAGGAPLWAALAVCVATQRPVPEARGRVVEWLGGELGRLLAGLSHEALGTRQAALAARLQAPPSTLEACAAAAWAHILPRTYDFGRAQRMAGIVERVTPADLAEMYQSLAAGVLCEVVGAGGGRGAGIVDEEAGRVRGSRGRGRGRGRGQGRGQCAPGEAAG